MVDASRTPRSRGVRLRRWAGWLFVLPALVTYAAFVLVPLAMTVQYSTLRWNGIGESTFVGVDNYVRTLTDPTLLGIILNAFKLVVFFCGVPVLLGLLVALGQACGYFGWIYHAGVAAVALLLGYEHWLVRPDDLSRVNQAFFQVNGVISVGLFLLVLVQLAVGV